MVGSFLTFGGCLRNILLFVALSQASNFCQAQVVYKIEKGDRVQYVIPTTNFAEPGEFGINEEYIRLLSRAERIRVHVGGGIINTRNIRNPHEYYRYEDKLVEYARWCTNRKVDFGDSNNRNIRVSSLLNIDACTIGDTSLREKKMSPSSVATVDHSIAFLTSKKLAKINPRVAQDKPLTEMNAWVNQAFHVEDSLAKSYFGERAFQWAGGVNKGRIQEVESLPKVLERGRGYVDSWLARFGRFQHQSSVGAEIAKEFIGGRADLLARSIYENFEARPPVEQINFVPFEYLYLDFGVLNVLEQRGIKVQEFIFKN